VRDGLWAGMLAAMPAGLLLVLERVTHLDLYSEFAHTARVLQISQLPARMQAHPAASKSSGANRLRSSWCRAWLGRVSAFPVELPADTTPERLTELSSMFGAAPGGGPTEATHPVEFAFSAPAAVRRAWFSPRLRRWRRSAGVARRPGDLRQHGRRCRISSLGYLAPTTAPPPLAIAYPRVHTITLEARAVVGATRPLIVPDIGATFAPRHSRSRFRLVRVQADEAPCPRQSGCALPDWATGLQAESHRPGDGRRTPADRGDRRRCVARVALTASDTALVIAR